MLNISEEFVWNELKEDDLVADTVSQAIRDVQEYLTGTYYESKNTRLAEYIATQPDLFELVISVFTTLLLNGRMTLQAICGMLNYKIGCTELLDRVKTIGEILAVISWSELIHIHKRGAGQYIMVESGINVDLEIPYDDAHELNKYPAQIVGSNRDEILGSMILGSPHNHHDQPICLSHLNKMNRIPLTLSVPLLEELNEKPTFDFITEDQEEQWIAYREQCLHKYVQTVRELDNKFYLVHKYDTRGRCYALGYHMSTQGTSFKKAIVQLYHKEIITDEL